MQLILWVLKLIVRKYVPFLFSSSGLIWLNFVRNYQAYAS